MQPNFWICNKFFSYSDAFIRSLLLAQHTGTIATESRVGGSGRTLLPYQWCGYTIESKKEAKVQVWGKQQWCEAYKEIFLMTMHVSENATRQSLCPCNIGFLWLEIVRGGQWKHVSLHTSHWGIHPPSPGLGLLFVSPWVWVDWVPSCKKTRGHDRYTEGWLSLQNKAMHDLPPWSIVVTKKNRIAKIRVTGLSPLKWDILKWSLQFWNGSILSLLRHQAQLTSLFLITTFLNFSSTSKHMEKVHSL